MNPSIGYGITNIVYDQSEEKKNRKNEKEYKNHVCARDDKI